MSFLQVRVGAGDFVARGQRLGKSIYLESYLMGGICRGVKEATRELTFRNRRCKVYLGVAFQFGSMNSQWEVDSFPACRYFSCRHAAKDQGL